MKLKGIIAALLAAILIVFAAYHAFPQGEPEDICMADVTRNREKLESLIREHQGTYVNDAQAAYRQFARLLRLELSAVDLRNPSCAVFNFSALPEMNRRLCYSPDDRYAIDDVHVVTAQNENMRLERLGMGGKGYIQCYRICEGWFYIDAYYPT